MCEKPLHERPLQVLTLARYEAGDSLSAAIWDPREWQRALKSAAGSCTDFAMHHGNGRMYIRPATISVSSVMVSPAKRTR